ncbi:Uncharacterised protein [uncultured archaeon]|nr:Uncharacterised protein [uncultured archaeon]
MEQKNPVYVKMEYSESIESKKNILSTEVSLLNLIKSLKEYHSIRLEELKIKAQIYKAIKELNLTMRKTKSTFPFLKIPEKNKKENLPLREARVPKEKVDNNLESELQEIQEKLRNLGM